MLSIRPISYPRWLVRISFGFEPNAEIFGCVNHSAFIHLTIVHLNCSMHTPIAHRQRVITMYVPMTARYSFALQCLSLSHHLLEAPFAISHNYRSIERVKKRLVAIELHHTLDEVFKEETSRHLRKEEAVPQQWFVPLNALITRLLRPFKRKELVHLDVFESQHCRGCHDFDSGVDVQTSRPFRCT